jgi:hypothetical protein
MDNTRRISTGLSDSERLRELLWQSIRSPGLNPENTFLLLATLLEREFPEEPGEDLEAKSVAFRRLVESPHTEGGLDLPAERLRRILADFTHPQEVAPRRDPQVADRMTKMRERVTRLLPGRTADTPGGAREQGRITALNQKTAAGVIRRLNRDRPDLAQAVAERRMSANAAAIAAGFRKRKVSVSVDSPAAVMRTLRRHLTHDQLTELAELLLKDRETDG